MDKITFDDFKKVEMMIGKVISVERVEGSEKLLKLSVDFGEEAPRQVISGIAKSFPDPAVLIGQSFPFVTNLEPRMIMGLESQAMILAVSGEASLGLLRPTVDIAPGIKLS